MLIDYLPVLIHVAVAIGFASVALIANIVLGRAGTRTPTKDSAYECGMLPITKTQPRFSVKFYLVAMLFLLFDLEAVFFYPFGALFRELGWYGFGAISVFTVPLVVGLLYEWRKGALEW